MIEYKGNLYTEDEFRELKLAIERGEMFVEGVREDAKEEVNELNAHLITDNRMDDLKRSVTDSNYQMQLMKEYSLL